MSHFGSGLKNCPEHSIVWFLSFSHSDACDGLTTCHLASNHHPSPHPSTYYIGHLKGKFPLVALLVYTLLWLPSAFRTSLQNSSS